MTDERLEAGQAIEYLSACVCIARAPVRTSTWFQLTVEALDAAYAERPLLLAPTLVLDLSVLLQGERLGPLDVEAPSPLREALRSYEDHVLARLTADRRWTRVAEGIAAAPREHKATAIAIVVTQVLARLGTEGGTALSQAVVRRLGTLPPSDVLEQGRAALANPEVCARIAEGLLTVSKAFRRAREVLSDAEVFVVENIRSLKSLAARVALTQLATAAQQVEERLPARLKGRVFEDGDAPTSLEEDSAFPVGGFASLSTQGSLENLVTSELIYMDDDGAPRPDLFDVRFVEGELLYYARDESVAVRRKRRVVMVLAPSLVAARVLDAKGTYQRLMWLLGALSALVRKMAGWFDSEALTFEVVFVRDRDAVLAEELGVTSLVLREFRERGQVEFSECDSTAQACTQARSTWRQRARVLVFGTKFPSGLDEQSEPDAWVSLAGPRPELVWRDATALESDPELTTPEVWAHLTRALIEGLLAPSQPKRR